MGAILTQPQDEETRNIAIGIAIGYVLVTLAIATIANYKSIREAIAVGPNTAAEEDDVVYEEAVGYDIDDFEVEAELEVV